jgi:light-regulated signal transduction histidine kinase (bacteriophytochrome)
MPHSAELDALPDPRSAAAEQELQAFSYIVSHDLAASFRHVSEFSRLLLGELGDGLTGRQQVHADRIRAATDKCHSMMEQLLVFSRVQQKRLEPVRQDAVQTLRLAMMQTGVDAGGSGLTIEPLGEVFADADLLTVALGSLLDNAFKFRRPGVPTRIAVRPAHDEGFWRARITDNGIGVEPAYREKAFQMFSRLNGEAAYPGVGAGLALCRRIARRHGGDVSFVDCDDGACVELALPRGPTLQ